MIQELIEAEAWGDPIDTRAYLNDDPSFGLGSMAAPFTSIDDRADGKLWPIYRVEQDLARIRMVARRLSSVTGTSIGVVDALANYTLGNGYEFKASGAEQSLVASVQAAIDELLNRWQFVGGLDRELHGRSREDGEALVAIERGSDGWPSLLIIEPDCLTEPGDTRSMENYCQDYHSPQSWSFGVRTAARNTAEVLGYHVAFDAGGADWEYYPEARLQHLKRNATRAAKRGVSDWYSVAGDVVREAKLRRNTMQGATLQAAIAWILQSPAGTTEAQSAAIGSGGSVGTYQRSVGNNGPQTYQRKDYPAGSVLTPSAGLEYHPGPMGAERNAGFLEVAQYALRSIGVRWNMPEAMVSGDASNANYASSLVAEAPFVKAREADQAFYSEHFKRLVWKALRFMWECGLLQIPCGFDQLKTLIDIKVDCPKVASRDPQEQASTAAAYVAMGAMSVRTASVEAGYDYDQEVSNGAAKAAPPPMPGMPGDPAQNVTSMSQNTDPSMMLPESHCDGNDMQQAVAIALESVATDAEARGVLAQLVETKWVTIDEHPVPIEDGEVALGKMAERKHRAMKSAKKPEHLGDLSQYTKDDLFNWLNYQGGKEWIDSHGDADSKYRALSKLGGEHENAVRAKEKTAKPTRREMTKEEAADNLKKGFLVSPGIMKKYPELEALVNPIHKMVPKIRDVTPEGYGPGKSTPDSVEAFPHGQTRHQTTEEQSLRRSIADAQTILKGKVSGDKRAAVEKSLKDSTEKLSKIVKESEGNG